MVKISNRALKKRKEEGNVEVYDFFFNLILWYFRISMHKKRQNCGLDT